MAQTSLEWFTVGPWVPGSRRGLLVCGGQVARGGGDVLVAEELLEPRDRAVVGEVAQCEAVAQRVRVRELRGHEFLAGNSHDQSLVRIEDMLDWAFYGIVGRSLVEDLG